MTKGSISAAARGMGINRAQFEKYVSGEREASPTIRKTIADHFNIDEASLFLSPDLFTLHLPQRSKIQIGTEILRATQPLLEEPSASIAPGIYHIYFTVPGTPDKLLMSAMVISRVGSATVFRRLTGWGVQRDAYWSRFTGDHKGLVVERLNCLSFVAANQRGQHDPTMMRVRWLPVAARLLGGHALVMSHAGPSFSAVVMHPLPQNTKLRAAIRAAQPCHSSDVALPPLVRDFIPLMRRDLLDWVKRDIVV